MTTFTAYIEFDEETQLYVGVVPGVPGAHTQAPSLDELRANLPGKCSSSASRRRARYARGRPGSSGCSRSRSPEWRDLLRSIPA